MGKNRNFQKDNGSYSMRGKGQRSPFLAKITKIFTE